MLCRRTNRQLANYDRGILTAEELARKLIEETTVRPSVDFVVRLPTEALSIIREKASVPPEAKWILFGGGDLNRFLTGLALWREYFDSLEEEQT